MAKREFPVDLVRKHCYDYLEDREIRIQVRREEAILRVMKKEKHFWSRKPYTRDEAINYLKTVPNLIPEWYAIGWSGLRWKGRVEDIIQLCSAEGSDTIVLDEEEASLLF